MNTAMLLLALAVSFLFPYWHARTYGSDHSVHLFLASVIRENRHRLFSRVPRLLNDSYCGGYPLFLHWLLSFLDRRQIDVVARLLNPMANLAQVLVCFLLLQSTRLAPVGGWACLCLALTPQFHHLNSARTWGLSSRSIGIVLVIAFLSLARHDDASAFALWWWTIALLTAYLIWGFNTFAMQTMTLASLVSGALFGQWSLLGVAICGMLVFLLLHGRYAFHYIVHTFLFIRAYATSLAKVFILRARFSIWRDLVYDIWVRIAKNIKDGTGYAYNNPVVIVLFLNPLVVIVLVSLLANIDVPSSTVQFCRRVTAVGAALFLLTSFRWTRFLGEPERYIEMLSVFSTVAGLSLAYRAFGLSAIILILSYYLLWDVVQAVLSRRASRKVGASQADISRVEACIRSNYRDGDVRLTSNSEQVSKRLMGNPWHFARIWSIEEGFAGFRLQEIMTEFPYIHRTHLETAAARYRVNAIVLDKSAYQEVFEDSVDGAQRELLLDTETLRLYRMRWMAATPSQLQVAR